MPLVGIVGIALVWLETRSLNACGLQRRTARAWLGWTLLLLALVIGLVNPLVQPLIDALTGTKADYSGYGALRGNFTAAAQLAGGAWLSAALGEELVFRAFLMHHLDHLLRRHRGGQVMAALAGGALFGAMHLSQGISGVLLTGLVGALFGYVYLRSGRNLWAMVLAHGVIDTWGIATLYLGWY
ncbi:CPBP family intramembrane glutamic endopeptidase [Xanthomonas arboricola]|uniref:CPBP family intramembrane glutamic endopeptidase n=1 Tax=Xanthomonas arboricola TaxID=56448 RepID=UPI000E0E9515|nr:CPBP family intramembrane glutamic endopeptidase [Xanthomonas arboricola]